MSDLSDEEMRKLLKPCPTEQDVLKIIESYYCKQPANDTFRVVRPLDSYDDCNFQVEIENEMFLLKIHNGVESNDFIRVMQENQDYFSHDGGSSSVIHFQSAIMWALTQHGICTSVPVFPTNDKSSSSPVVIATVPVVSPDHSPAHLAIRLLQWVPGCPMSDDTPVLAMETLAEAGKMLGKIHHALDDWRDQREPSSTCMDPRIRKHLHNPALQMPGKRYHQWDGKNTMDLKGFLHHISTDKRRSMVESVLHAFEESIVPAAVNFRTGINHGDFNGEYGMVSTHHDLILAPCDKDANIMVQGNAVSGVIDFGDSVESWRVLDVAVAMAYAMLSSLGKKNMSIAAAAAFLRGYHSVYPLTDDERKHLPLLMACRLSCSVTLGAFSFSQNPTNTYLLLHSEPAWEALDLIFGMDVERRESTRIALQRVFQQACKQEELLMEKKDGEESFMPCHDISMPDPSVPDLLSSIRAPK